MVKVYFETENGSYCYQVATFEDEEMYSVCLPALKAKAKKARMIVTETVE